MAIVLVENHLGGAFSTATAANIQYGTAAAWPDPDDVTVGNLLVVGVVLYNQTLAAGGCTDGSGNTYSQDVVRVATGDTSTAIYSSIIETGGDLTITVDSPGGNSYFSMGVAEFSGVSAADKIDDTSSATGGGTDPATSSVTVTTGTELIVAAFGTEYSVGAGITEAKTLIYEQPNGSYIPFGMQYTLTDASTDMTWDCVTSPTQWAAVGVSYNVAAGGQSIVPLIVGGTLGGGLDISANTMEG